MQLNFKCARHRSIQLSFSGFGSNRQCTLKRSFELFFIHASHRSSTSTIILTQANSLWVKSWLTGLPEKFPVSVNRLIFQKGFCGQATYVWLGCLTLVVTLLLGMS